MTDNPTTGTATSTTGTAKLDSTSASLGSTTMSSTATSSAAAGTESHLVIQPTDLTFAVPNSSPRQCVLLLQNRTESMVSFKIKTTAPKCYCVRPNVGFVAPHAQTSVAIVLNASRPGDPPLRADQHKFQVLTTIIDPEKTLPADVAKLLAPPASAAGTAAPSEPTQAEKEEPPERQQTPEAGATAATTSTAVSTAKLKVPTYNISADTQSLPEVAIAAKTVWGRPNPPADSATRKQRLRVRFVDAPQPTVSKGASTASYTSTEDQLFQSALGESHIDSSRPAPVFAPTIRKEAAGVDARSLSELGSVAVEHGEADAGGSMSNVSASDSRSRSLAKQLQKQVVDLDREREHLAQQLRDTAAQRDELQRRVSKLASQVSVLELREQSELRRRQLQSAGTQSSGGSSASIAAVPAYQNPDVRMRIIQLLIVALLFFILGKFVF